MTHKTRQMRRRALAIALATTLSTGPVFAAETTKSGLQPPQNDSAPKWRSVSNSRNSIAIDARSPETRVASNGRSVPASPWGVDTQPRPNARQRRVPTNPNYETGLPSEAELNARYFSGDRSSVVTQPVSSISRREQSVNSLGVSQSPSQPSQRQQSLRQQSLRQQSLRQQSQWQRNDAFPSVPSTGTSAPHQTQPPVARPNGGSGIHLGGPVANTGNVKPQSNTSDPYTTGEPVASQRTELVQRNTAPAVPVDGGWQTLPTSGVAYRESQLQRSNSYSSRVPENYSNYSQSPTNEFANVSDHSKIDKEYDSQSDASHNSESVEFPRFTIAPAPATPAGVSQFVSEPERVDILENNVRSLPLVDSPTIELSGEEKSDGRQLVQRNRQSDMAFNNLPSARATNIEPNVPVEPAADPDAHLVVPREEMARQISRKNLLADYAQSRGAVPVAVESPVGWQAVEQELRQRLDACDRLLRRGAPLSAREEAFRGVRALTRSIDARQGTYVCEPSFELAMTALQEAKDFYDSLTRSTSKAKTADIVQTHETPVLQNADLRGVSPEIAAQHYRVYARDMLVRATQNHPWGADMFFAIGKSYETQSNQDASIRRVNMENASVFYHAAVRTNPQQGDAANQLGYALLHLDRTGEAKQALAHAYQTQPNADVVRNLAELYRRTGNEAQLGWTSQQLAILDPPSEKKETPQVDLMTPQQFAAISPPVQSVAPNGQVIASSSRNPSPVVAPATTDSNEKSGNVATSWFKKIFK